MVLQLRVFRIDQNKVRQWPLALSEVEWVRAAQKRDEAWAAEQKVKGWTRKKKKILIEFGLAGFKK